MSLRVTIEEKTFYLINKSLEITGTSGSGAVLEGRDYGGPVKAWDHEGNILFDEDMIYKQSGRFSMNLGADLQLNSELDPDNLPERIVAGGNLTVSPYKDYISK